MTTEYQGYTQQATGATNWGDTLNQTLAEIDSDVIAVQSSAPDTADNVPWLDTSQSPPVFKVVESGGYVRVEADASTYKSNDIDSDGDGRVDEADQAFGYKSNDIDDDGDGIVNNSDKLEGKTYVEHLIDAPNGQLDTALLEDTETTSITVRVPDTETLTVYAWGVWKVSDGTAPTGLEAELVDQSGTVQTSANTTWTENTGGVASYQNTSGSQKIYRLRANNATGNNYTTNGVGGAFAYIVE